jgi:hypothetical protein
VARALTWKHEEEWGESQSNKQLTLTHATNSRKGMWFEMLNEGEVAARRDLFLAHLYSLLLKEEVFCENTDRARVRLMSQESMYCYNHFLKTDCYGGGTTYMASVDANQFVRVHNDNINNPAFRGSVGAGDFGFLGVVRFGLWVGFVFVIVWWQTQRPGRSGQSVLAAESLRTVPAYTFMVGGGPLLHVLTALYYAFFRQDALGKWTDLAVESYGTKKLAAVALQDPGQRVALKEQDPRVENVIASLEESLDEVAPMQMKRLKLFLDKHYGMRDGHASDMVWGVGCTVQCAAEEGPCAWPVVRCGEVPWQDLLNQGDPAKFFAETATIKGAKKLFPFVPLQSKDVATWPIYGVLPLCMQPTTFTAAHDWESALGGRGHTHSLRSRSIRRVQQYNVAARFAAGEHGLQRKTTARLSEVPGQVVQGGNQVTVNLAMWRDRVVEFQDLVKSLLGGISNHHGGGAIIEVAVPVRVTFACAGTVGEEAAVSSELRKAVYDAILLAQENTVAYDGDAWTTIIEFFVGALRSRVSCTVAMMAKVSADPREDVVRQDELTDYMLEVADVVKRFYNGVGCMGTKARSLPRCAYMYDRAILGRMRTYALEHRNKDTSWGGIDWLHMFYGMLGMSKADAISIPDYVPAERQRRLTQLEEGYACPYCWNLYRQNEAYHFKNHPCQGRATDGGGAEWVKLSGARFRNHHEKARARLTDEQKLLIELLDDPALNPNIYLGGLAGVGKSFAVRVAREHICMKYGMSAIAVIAPTHIAAQNVGGRTIHSFLGLTHSDSLVPKDESDFHRAVTNFLKNKEVQATELQHNLQFLIVDEVGMLAAKSLGLLEYFLRSLKRTGLDGEEVGNFGDVRILLVGDPLQVPPVEVCTGGGYFFQSEAFTARESRFVVLYLRQIFRSLDVPFLNFQARSRLGYEYVTVEHVAYANRTLGTAVDECEDGWLEEESNALHAVYKVEVVEKRTMSVKLDRYYCMSHRMTGKTDRRKKLNRSRLTLAPGRSAEEGDTPGGHMPYTICVENAEGDALDKLYLRSFRPQDLKTLHARDEGGTVPGNAKLSKCVTLAEGMRVRVLTNDYAPMVASKSVVDVVGIDAETVRVTIRVTLPDGRTADVEMDPVVERFQVGDRRVTRVQFPLSPCGSGTTYQVQGQTLHKRCCVYSNERIKEGDFGHAYTVISRHTDPAYIKALHDWDRRDFRAAEEAVRFDQFHSQQASCVSSVTYSFPAKNGKRVRTCHLRREEGRRCVCLMCCGPAEFQGRTMSALKAAEEERLRNPLSATPREEEGTDGGWDDSAQWDADEAALRSTSEATADNNGYDSDNASAAGRKMKRRRNGGAPEGAKRRRSAESAPLDVPVCCVGTLHLPTDVTSAGATRTMFSTEEEVWIVLASAALKCSEAEKTARAERRKLMQVQLKKQGETLRKALSEVEQLYYFWNQRFNWDEPCEDNRRPLTLKSLKSKVYSFNYNGGSGVVEAVVINYAKGTPYPPYTEAYPPYTDIFVTQSSRVYVFGGDEGQEHCLSKYIKPID